MNVGELDELMGKYCRVISKLSDSEETFYDFGTVKYVNHEFGFVLVDTKSGLKRLRIEDIFDASPIVEYVTKKFEE